MPVFTYAMKLLTSGDPGPLGYGLLIISLKLLGLWRKRKLSIFISITAADDKTQMGPQHWLLG